MFIMIRVMHPKNVNCALATNYVDEVARGIEKHVIGIAHDRKLCDYSPGVRIENNQARRQPAADKKPCVSFIERHRIVSSSPV